ncbi:ATP-binding protein, partial [Corynebacterium mendelii]
MSDTGATTTSSRTRSAGYPFSAVVGQDQLRLALILTAISPRIGGVVIRGEKGTAKTTTVRGFQKILGDAPLVQLPIGATEDRVVGSLDVETVLTTGKAQYKPGLLVQADGGILYVDEVNLLADHLVDALLDAAATGQVTIERDGISHTSATDFVLVGTMNPEEGELRPQLLDRFGLAVDVAASRDVEVRTAIMRQRLAYEADPDGFAASFAEEDTQVTRAIARARDLVGQVVLTATNLARIAHICAAFDV